MATTGHEAEVINVQGLKASLQKLKDDMIDTKVANVSYNSTSGKIQKTIDGTTSDVVEIYQKSEIDAMRAPTYSASTKGIAFAANSDATYNSSTKGISLSH